MSASFALLVTGSPYGSQAHLSAQCFVEAIYLKGYTVECVFFYNDAVYVANQLNHPSNDERDPHRQWINLANQYQFPLKSCISVAQKRGMIDSEQAKARGFQLANIQAPFSIDGLGAWVEASEKSRFQVHFA